MPANVVKTPRDEAAGTKKGWGWLMKARPVKGYTRIVNGKMQQIAPHMDPRDAARQKVTAPKRVKKEEPEKGPSRFPARPKAASGPRPSETKGSALPRAGKKPAGGAGSKPLSAVDDYKRNGTKAKSFKSWFGDWEKDPKTASKVVDQAGKPEKEYNIQPLKVYHGTGAGGFREFRTTELSGDAIMGAGFYFTNDRGIAEEYTKKESWFHKVEKGKEKVYEVYLNIRKPYNMETQLTEEELDSWLKFYSEHPQNEDHFRGIRFDDLLDEKERKQVAPRKNSPVTLSVLQKVKEIAQKKRYRGQPEHRIFHRGKGITRGELQYIVTDGQHFIAEKEIFNDWLRSQGYDGITHEGGWNIGQRSHQVWIAFNPEQIKAVDNEGTFDPKSKDMFKSIWGWLIKARSEAWRTEPRDRKGRWTIVGGGGKYSTGKGPLNAEEKARIKALKLAPGWTDVRVNPDPEADLQAIAKDVKGRTVYVYSEAHKARQKAAKFVRMKRFARALPQMRKSLFNEAIDGNPAKGTEEAQIALLIDRTAFRVGSNRDTRASVKAYGASTLLARHVKVEGDICHFDFIAKKGVHCRKSVEDPELARMLKAKLQGKKPEDPLFQTTDEKVNSYLKSHGQFTAKDFRTFHATALAFGLVQKQQVPGSEKELKKARLEVARQVAEHLGNTPAVSLADYIDPAVFHPWEAALIGEGEKK